MADVIYDFDGAGKNWPFSNPNYPSICALYGSFFMI